MLTAALLTAALERVAGAVSPAGAWAQSQSRVPSKPF